MTVEFPGYLHMFLHDLLRDQTLNHRHAKQMSCQLNNCGYRKISIRRPGSNKRPPPDLDVKNGDFFGQFSKNYSLY